MKRPYFFNDMKLYSDDLNYLNDAKDDELNNRIQGFLDSSGGINNGNTSLVSGGVLGIPAEYLEDKNLKCEGLSDIITIHPGKALDINGELIYAPSTAYLLLGNSNAVFSWLGSPNVTNYIKIKYLEASGSLQTDDLGNPYYTRYTPGYFVTINEVAPIAGELLLGTFTATASGEVTGGVIADKRSYARLITSASSVYLDPLNKPLDAWETVEDHVNALGSGVVTETNPHGLTAADLGITDISGHNIQSHSTGIIAINGIYDSGVFGSFLATATDLGLESVVNFDLPSNAGILVGGFVYADSLAQVSLLDETIFTEGDGLYYLYMNNLGEVKASYADAGTNDPNRFNLCSIIRADNGSDFSSLTDQRKFYSTTLLNIRADVVEGSVIPTAALTNQSTLYDNLNRIRYQLGKAINGSSFGWSSVTFPLTAGPTSIADVYHTHTRTHANTFLINYDAANGDLEDMAIRMYRGSMEYASLKWLKNTDEFALYSDDLSGTLANLNVNNLFLGGNVLNFYIPDSVPTYPGIGIDLEATGSLLAPSGSKAEVDGDALTGLDEDALLGQSIFPALVYGHYSDGYFDLFSDRNTLTNGHLRLQSLNVDGQVVSALRIQSWDAGAGVSSISTVSQGSFSSDVDNSVLNLIYTGTPQNKDAYYKVLFAFTYEYQNSEVYITLQSVSPGGSISVIDVYSYYVQQGGALDGTLLAQGSVSGIVPKDHTFRFYARTVWKDHAPTQRSYTVIRTL